MSFQAYLDNIEEKTGKTPRQFIALAKERGYDDPGTKARVIVDWLKADFDLGRGGGAARSAAVETRSSIGAVPAPSADRRDLGKVCNRADIAGEALHRISRTDTDTLDQVGPALSPDGRRVAYGKRRAMARSRRHRERNGDPS